MSRVPTETPAAAAKVRMIGKSDAEASCGASSTLVTMISGWVGLVMVWPLSKERWSVRIRRLLPHRGAKEQRYPKAIGGRPKATVWISCATLQRERRAPQ
jgi:hypothetical protein